MEQLYMIEIFVDKLSVFVKDEEDSDSNEDTKKKSKDSTTTKKSRESLNEKKSGESVSDKKSKESVANKNTADSATKKNNEDKDGKKNLIALVKFGPGTQFLIKENQLAIEDDKNNEGKKEKKVNKEKKEEKIETDEEGRKKWSRTLRAGKSFLFPSYPDTILEILSKFPLEIELWTDDPDEEPIFVGVGKMVWDKSFFQKLKETSNARKLHEPFAVKQKALLYAECCCNINAEIEVIVRLNALGSTITTEYQQLMNDPERFVFRTNKTPNMFECKKVMGDDPNFTMIGSLYETTMLQNPDAIGVSKDVIEVCTELTSCGVDTTPDKYKCHNNEQELEEGRKLNPIEKIRMGDISGPCGNTNCALAQKVKMYIRNLESYKKKAENNKTDTDKNEESDQKEKKVCGACICKDETQHREDCPELKPKPKNEPCSSCCESRACEDKQEIPESTASTPPTCKKQSVNYVFNVNEVPTFKDAVCGVRNNQVINNVSNRPVTVCCYQQKSAMPSNVHNPITTDKTPKEPRNQRISVYPCNQNISANPRHQSISVYEVEIREDKDCRCRPIKPPSSCKAVGCECTYTEAETSRKVHKPYCANYKHKELCPNNIDNTVEENKDVNEVETEPLPFDLPPIKLGPCPVLCRPCCVPNGFAKMYKNSQQPMLPPSYSEAGKVCCEQELKRIKKVLKPYMKFEKDNDFRCLNQFLADTEKKCCDKEDSIYYKEDYLSGKGCSQPRDKLVEEKCTKNQPL